MLFLGTITYYNWDFYFEFGKFPLETEIHMIAKLHINDQANKTLKVENQNLQFDPEFFTWNFP